MKGNDWLSVAVTVAFDGAKTSPEEAAEWVAKFAGQAGAAGIAPAGTTATTGVTSPHHGEVDGVQGQLDRLTAYSPAFASRVRRVHEGLVELGYVATLPAPRKAERLPSYISCVDPVTSKNFANLNSVKAYIQRRELRDQLEGQPHVGVDSRYAHVALVSDEATAFLIDVAKKLKE